MLPVGAKINFTVNAINIEGSITAPEYIISVWTLNGETKPDPSFGKLSSSLAFITATYQAPETSPAPAAVPR
jgi:hypothetical protein